MKKQRVRDPIHGLISFDVENERTVDGLAWKLIDCPEFQRLRRIKQLGVSEFVFPGATHTRFAHSIGVFHNARHLMKVVEREEGRAFDTPRAKVALVAALVHDVGHGPFSHAFETAREFVAKERQIGSFEDHEAFSGKIIRNQEGEIWKRIVSEFDEKFAQDVADLIQAENPLDIYHAVVSSSFDADRLDYLVRDRYMTGVESAAIDQEWLIDNLCKHEILIPQDDDPEPIRVPTFVFRLKGRQGAEDFLLARHRLYSQVYLHKTTRGFEKLVSTLLYELSKYVDKPEEIGLTRENGLVRFFALGGDTLQNYLALDDITFWGAAQQLLRTGTPRMKMLASRLLNRENMRVIDVSAEYADNEESCLNAIDRIDHEFEQKLNVDVFKDVAPNLLYGTVSGETRKAHKMIRVLNGHADAIEIQNFPDTIISNELTKKRESVRYYFLNESDYSRAQKAMRGK